MGQEGTERLGDALSLSNNYLPFIGKPARFKKQKTA
jgi:hypothetical protein